mgnify:CR=1 FL=1
MIHPMKMLLLALALTACGSDSSSGGSAGAGGTYTNLPNVQFSNNTTYNTDGASPYRDRSAYDTYRLLPSVLRDVSQRTLATQVLGHDSSMPLVKLITTLTRMIGSRSRVSGSSRSTQATSAGSSHDGRASGRCAQTGAGGRDSVCYSGARPTWKSLQPLS